MKSLKKREITTRSFCSKLIAGLLATGKQIYKHRELKKKDSSKMCHKVELNRRGGGRGKSRCLILIKKCWRRVRKMSRVKIKGFKICY